MDGTKYLTLIYRGAAGVGISRKYRRMLEKKFKKDKDPMAEIKRASESVYQQLNQKKVDRETHDLVSAMYYLVGISLHREYGWGPTRIMRVYEHIDQELAKWQDGSADAGRFREILEEEVGIKLAIQ